MRGFTNRPKTLAPPTNITKRSFTSEDVPKSTQDGSSSMRRASTNEDLVSMEVEALGTAPPPPRAEWAHKQLLGMVNRSADGQRVVGDEDDFMEPQSSLNSSGFSNPQGKSKSLIVGLDHSGSAGNSQPLVVPGITQARALTSSSSTSALPIGNLRRETKSTSAFENRLRLKREKDQHMARMIMEEEHKKARDREKLREAEERMKAKAREQQEQQRLQSYYEQMQDKQSQQASPHSSSEDNFAYFRSMKKKIKDINVKPTLPSIGLDEKLKKLNTRVKGFLNTTQPSLPKFRSDKRNSKQLGKNMPIKLNIVDDFMKDLELQRMAEESSLDSRDDGHSPPVPRAAEYDIHSSANSSPSGDIQQKQVKRSRKRLSELRLANRSTNELQLLIRSLSQDLQANNEAILAAQQTCAKIRTEMENTKTIFTVDIDSATSKISRASTLGTQFVTTVQDIQLQLVTTRSATSSCSDQIKQLEQHVQKVQRAKKPTDKLIRYLLWIPIGILLLYFVYRSGIAKILVVLSVFVWVLRTVREQNASAAAKQLANFQEVAPAVYEPDEPEDLFSSSEIQPPVTLTDPSSPTFTKKRDPVIAATTSIRRNHSDLVLQSLLSEEEFADVLQDSGPRLRTLREDESMGISPKTKSKSSNHLVGSGGSKTEEPAKVGGSSRSSGNALRGPLRTSANNKDSVAMNLALHNLNQMSLKIQQMQQGK